MKKMFQISEETHSLFFSIKRQMEVELDSNLTVDECVKRLIYFWKKKYMSFPKDFEYKVRDLEPSN